MPDFQKGQTVAFTTTTHAHSTPYYTPHQFRPDDTATVTAVRRKTITVRHRDTSYNVPREHLAAPNGEAWVAPPPKPKPRPIGQAPEGAIAVDDPRLEWIWEDAARIAKDFSYCREYDRLTDRLGIPGRLRSISVNQQIEGMSITATVQARSEKEAKQILKDKLTKLSPK